MNVAVKQKDQHLAVSFKHQMKSATTISTSILLLLKSTEQVGIVVTFCRQFKADFSLLLPQKSHYSQASETQGRELLSSSPRQKHRLGSQMHSLPQTGLVFTSSNRAQFRTFINSSSAWPRSVSAAALVWLSS